jgi:TonB family protein
MDLLISFSVTEAGLVRDVAVMRSSAYTDVDLAVLEALRGWTFAPSPGAPDIRGQVTYAIRPE